MSDYLFPFVWRISEQDVTILLVTEKGLQRERPIHLTYSPQKGELLWAKDKQATQHYRKAAKSP